jgi:hypothetical protein
MGALSGDSAVQGVAAVVGSNSAGGDGVIGYGTKGGRGVVGVSDTHTGVEGNCDSGIAVYGSSKTGRGVVGVATNGSAVEGNTSGMERPCSARVRVGARQRFLMAMSQSRAN